MSLGLCAFRQKPFTSEMTEGTLLFLLYLVLLAISLSYWIKNRKRQRKCSIIATTSPYIKRSTIKITTTVTYTKKNNSVKIGYFKSRRYMRSLNKELYNFRNYRQRSVCGKCPVPGDQPKSNSLALSQYLDRSAACISKRWAGGHFSETVDWGQTVKWPTAWAQVFRSFPVPSCQCDTA